MRSAAEADPGRLFDRIDDVEDLHEHLQCAIELEHSTLPPYLCALYSLDRKQNPVPAEIMLSVFVEEMLHLTLAANLLNAVGGRPRLDAPQLLPGYPRSLPHGDEAFAMSLLPFGKDALAQFARVERPAPVGAPAQCDRYATIGQFYSAIRLGLTELCADMGEAALFCGDPARQVTESLSYGGSGCIIRIDGFAAALAALDEIVEQGEGFAGVDVWDGETDMFHPERDEVAHFYRIEELMVGRRYRRGDSPSSGPTGEPVTIDWDGVQPMRRDQRVADAPGTAIRVRQEAFNVSYCELLGQLDQALDGQPQLVGAAVGTMYGLKSQAEELMRIPLGDDSATAGPTFEWVPVADRR